MENQSNRNWVTAVLRWLLVVVTIYFVILTAVATDWQTRSFFGFGIFWNLGLLALSFRPKRRSD